MSTIEKELLELIRESLTFEDFCFDRECSNCLLDYELKSKKYCKYIYYKIKDEKYNEILIDFLSKIK